MLLFHTIFHIPYCSTPTIFISVYYKRNCSRILKENEGTPDASTRFGTGKPNANCPNILPYTQQIGGKITAAGGRLQVRNCTKIYLRLGFARPRWGGSLRRFSKPPSRWGRSSQIHPASALRDSDLGSPFALPWKKSCGRPCSWVGK